LMVVAGGTGEWSKFQPAAIAVRSWASLLYLIVLGSIVTFTAYTWLLDHVSPTLVSTHTYVNPIIAVLIGWLWAGELVNSRVIGAGVLTLLAVFLISKGTSKRMPAPTQDAELP